jgi:hypothetical protein
MNRKQLLAMWATILLLVSSWIYLRVEEYQVEVSHGTYLVHLTSGLLLDHGWSKIDYQRLVFLDGMILLIGLGIFATVRKSPRNPNFHTQPTATPTLFI